MLVISILLILNILISLVELIGDSRSPSQKFVNYISIITSIITITLLLIWR